MVRGSNTGEDSKRRVGDSWWWYSIRICASAEMNQGSDNCAELARKLKVSRAYITMLCSGQRNLSKKLRKKVNKLGLTNEFISMTLNQQVRGSIPLRLTKY